MNLLTILGVVNKQDICLKGFDAAKNYFNWLYSCYRYSETRKSWVQAQKIKIKFQHFRSNLQDGSLQLKQIHSKYHMADALNKAP